MPFVVDASIAAAWFMPDEFDPTAEHAFDLLKLGAPLPWRSGGLKSATCSS
jgi:hypothetical protein